MALAGYGATIQDLQRIADDYPLIPIIKKLEEAFKNGEPTERLLEIAQHGVVTWQISTSSRININYNQPFMYQWLEVDLMDEPYVCFYEKLLHWG